METHYVICNKRTEKLSVMYINWRPYCVNGLPVVHLSFVLRVAVIRVTSQVAA